MVELERSPLFMRSQKLNYHKHCSQWDQLQATSYVNRLQLVSRKRTSFHQENIRPHVSLMIRQKLLQFGWEVLIHCLDSLDISPLYSIYFGLYKIPVMEKISISWKTVKSTCNHSLFKEVKSFGKMGLWSFLENSRLYWNNTLITVFNEVLGENEKCMFYLNITWIFWPTQYNTHTHVHMCGHCLWVAALPPRPFLWPRVVRGKRKTATPYHLPWTLTLGSVPAAKAAPVCCFKCLWVLLIPSHGESHTHIHTHTHTRMHICSDTHTHTHAYMLSRSSCGRLCDPMDHKSARLLCLWDFLGKNTRVGCHAFLQGVFPTQGSNLISCISCVAEDTEMLV